ncbi:MAG: phosphatidylglycerol lysyltransferase domain-containing protein [Spirochaetes bacterium]|nr:phosphatidylglycerol lysyltransferase domain-containing protein [Spirochaetota bacterium]
MKIYQDLEFFRLTIQDKQLYDQYLAQKGENDISEYTFTNLFMWQNVRVMKHAEVNNRLVLLGTQKVAKFFLPPLGVKDYNEEYQELLKYGIDQKITKSIRRVPESIVNKLDKQIFQIEEDPDNYDYVYLTDDLAHLKGRRYSNKRGFVKKFQAEYTYEFRPYQASDKNACVRLAEHWFEKKKEDKQRCDECKAICEFLTHHHYFDVQGYVLIVNDKLIGFTFGEALNDDTFVMHFEKADTDYAGIYQWLNKNFAHEIILGNYRFINREQDLGIEGIRKAKQSYLPTKMIKKYNVYLR